MKSAEGKIDRHKVAACYIIAIATVKPMRLIKKDERYNAINETLALTVGFSLLRAFVIAAIKDKHGISEEESCRLIHKFENGIKLPNGSLINHGTYLDNFASEIYFGVLEGNISILSIAHELYLLEVFTRIG